MRRPCGPTNCSEQGAQCTEHARGRVDGGRAGQESSCDHAHAMLVDKIKRGTQEVYDVPSETTKFVHDFVVPRGYQREGAR